ncbi:hypothetical protein [Roseateles oligotrophus]|uniref:Secreted protein n=1 Tax=Roseateles oligotrophus TaxID=1769250 RepID=A0ABT2YMT4_9BURK|nr:hypothetical protein [Roseateles oligotrophus]MCV2371366.1 hypothetical protein [Roseateles oligotrophus]
MPSRITVASLVALLLAVGNASAGGSQLSTTCALTDAEFAASINTLRDWSKIHEFHKKNFPPCPDDGMFAEGYSELVVRTLSTEWVQFGQLGRLAAADAKFKAFVLRHIDATTNEADLRQIEERAKNACPAGHSALCRQVASAAGAAINELK